MNNNGNNNNGNNNNATSTGQDPALNKASDYVLNIYDKLTYYDLYGSSIFIVIIATLVVLASISFAYLIQNRQEIASDWENQRCKPQYIPFAGYIVQPEGELPSQYTYSNIQYCIQRSVTNMTSELTKPHVYLLSTLSAAFSATADALNNLRAGMSSLRTNISVFALNVLQRLANLLAPFLKIFLACKDIINKIQGILAAGLFTFLGTYYTIQSFIGAFFELMLSMLLIFIGILGVLWAIPLSWPMALSLSIPVASFAAFFTIVVAVMSKMFHLPLIKTGKIKVPTSCFDKNTSFHMYNDTFKKISEIEAGDILADGTKVTAKMKLGLFNTRMFSLCGVIVSESHQVKYKDNWIFVREHPEAIEINGYKEPFIYCLNTSSKEIIIKGQYFLDWDELHDDSLERVLNICVSRMSNNTNNTNNRSKINIHKELDSGFSSDTIIELINTNKYISDVKIGDILKNGGVVYGLVEIDGTDLNKSSGLGNHFFHSGKLYHLLTTTQAFISNGQLVNDYNHIIDSIM